ncbi:hypothetical protein [Methanosarcina mazei]|uniref:hypothetical protein n=1 Tax=Methanosarcina mazei TaxID=2209 RepID=UPI0012FE9EA0|nr:hypothetical protein [Methanosarcina mazei]WIM47875.1 hypothetical protein PQQ20_06305 [Methanosarcina mazei]
MPDYISQSPHDYLLNILDRIFYYRQGKRKALNPEAEKRSCKKEEIKVTGKF